MEAAPLSEGFMSGKLSKNSSKESRPERVPESFTQALVHAIWRSRWRTLYLILGALFIGAFAIWTTLPESTKQHLLSRLGIPERAEKPGVTIGAGQPSKEVEERSPLPVDPALYSIMSRRGAFHGSIVVPLAQAHRGTTYSVLVWPLFVWGDRIADDDIFGVTLEKTESGEFKIVRDWGPGPGGREALEKELGGSDFIIRDRGAGAPLLELGPRFKTSWDRFHAALRSDARKDALEAAVNMSRLFTLDLAALDDAVTEILIAAYALGPSALEYRGTRARGMVADVEFRVTDERGSRRVVFEAGILDVEKDLWGFERIR